MNELNILKKVGQHPNVVCLVGACHIQGNIEKGDVACGNEPPKNRKTQVSLRLSTTHKDHRKYTKNTKTQETSKK